MKVLRSMGLLRFEAVLQGLHVHQSNRRNAAGQ